MTILIVKVTFLKVSKSCLDSDRLIWSLLEDSTHLVCFDNETPSGDYPSPGLHTKLKEPSLLYYFFKAEGRKVGFIPFLKLARCEMRTASFRIWTRVTEFTYYDDNRDTTCTSEVPHVDKVEKILH